jgi:hypothetical protein
LPRVSAFYGIVITIYWNEAHHSGRAHFHAEYAEDAAVFEIETGELIAAGAKPTEARRLWLRFEDGLEAEVDFSDMVEPSGLYSDPLKDPDYFRQVEIYPGGLGIFWPDEADVCPDTLYRQAQRAAGVVASTR